MTFTNSIANFVLGVLLVLGYVQMERLIKKAESRVRNRARQKE